MNPKVSIIIPAYNWSNYLWEAIESALAQTYKNIEILVINDGSNDNWETEKVAISFGDKIKYFNKTNWGVSTALNLGIEKMTWEYFSWLSHDDLYLPNKIEEQIKMLNTFKNKNIVISSNLEIIDNEWVYIRKNIIKYNTNELIYMLTTNSIINWCTLLIPKIILNKIWLFNKDLKTTQDYDMWVRILEKYNFKHLNKILIKSRVHKEQDTNKKSHLVIKEKHSFRKKTLKKIRLSKKFYIKKYIKLYIKIIILNLYEKYIIKK